MRQEVLSMTEDQGDRIQVRRKRIPWDVAGKAERGGPPDANIRKAGIAVVWVVRTL